MTIVTVYQKLVETGVPCVYLKWGGKYYPFGPMPMKEIDHLVSGLRRGGLEYYSSSDIPPTNVIYTGLKYYI